MKKIKGVYLIVWLVLWLATVFVYLIFVWKNQVQQQVISNSTNQDNVKIISDFLKQSYKDNYPIPTWDLIYLNSELTQIHLEDKSVSINQIPDLYIIQWNICWVELDNEQIKWNIDGLDKRKDLVVKWSDESIPTELIPCYSYAVTKDRKNFQLWYLINNDLWWKTSKLLWTLDWSITRDYRSNKLVEDWSSYTLPYSPYPNNKIIIKLVEWTPDLSINANWFDVQIPQEKLSSLKNQWMEFPFDNNKLANVEFEFNWDNFLYKFIYPNWNVQMVWPSDTWWAKVKIDNFQFNWANSNTSVINQLWKFTYSLVKLWDSSDFRVSDSAGTVITIRWTRFTTDVWWAISATILSEWSLSVKSWLEEYEIDQLNSLLWIGQNKAYVNLLKNVQKLSKLYSFGVAVDILLHDKDDFSTVKIEENLETLNAKNVFWTWDNYELYKLVNETKWKELWVIKSNEYFDSKRIDNNFWMFQLKKSLNDYMDEICISNWFNHQLKLNRAYTVLDVSSLYTDEGVVFDAIDWLDMIDEKTYILLNNHTKDNINLTYFDNWDKQIKYKWVWVSKRSWLDDKNIVIICE